jgi:hypothetical protein
MAKPNNKTKGKRGREAPVFADRLFGLDVWFDQESDGTSGEDIRRKKAKRGRKRVRGGDDAQK